MGDAPYDAARQEAETATVPMPREGRPRRYNAAARTTMRRCAFDYYARFRDDASALCAHIRA